MKKVIGIDLGTANSCVAILKDNKPYIIPDEEGRQTTPSIFAITANQEHLCGYTAQEQADSNRTNTIFAVKRLIGRRYDSLEVAEAALKLPYKIIPSPGGDAWVEVNKDPMSPEQVSSHVLIRMKEIAEHHLGHSVTHAVITVPAHFNDAERQATKDAGKIAGLEVLNIINEPTAAALAYGTHAVHEKDVVKNIAVFDLGGGTFDITILTFSNGKFNVLATGGDTYLGGEDFDLEIVSYLINEFYRMEGIDISQNKNILQRLKEAARTAKEKLSFEEKTVVRLPYICSSKDKKYPVSLNIPMTRKTLEQIVAPILARLEDPCLTAMEDADLKKADITDVILVGGMTRMPVVKKHCERIFGVKPDDSINPDEAVAGGAAIQAGLLQGLLTGMSLADVTSLTLGIEIQGGKMVPLIPRNTKIPVKVTEIFTTSGPNQTEVSIHLLQGESELVPRNKSLGKFEMTEIPPSKRGFSRIAVSLEVDADGIVHVGAKDMRSGEHKEIEIVNTSGLNEKEINKLLNENNAQQAYMDRKNNKASKTKKPTLNETARELRNQIFHIQYRLDTEGKYFTGKNRENLENCLAFSRATLDATESEEILAKVLEELTQAGQELMQHLEAA